MVVDDTVTIKTHSNMRRTILCQSVIIGGKEYTGDNLFGNEATIMNGKVSFQTEVSAIDYRINGGGWQSIPGVEPQGDIQYSVALPYDVGVEGATVELQVTLTDSTNYTVKKNDSPAVIESGYTYVNFEVCDNKTDASFVNVVVTFTTTRFSANLDELTFNFNGTTSGSQQTTGDSAAVFKTGETVTFDISGLMAAASITGDMRYAIKSASLDNTATIIWNDVLNTGTIDTSTLTEGNHTITLTLDPQLYYMLLTGISENGTDEYSNIWLSHDTLDSKEAVINFTVEPVSINPPDPDPSDSSASSSSSSSANPSASSDSSSSASPSASSDSSSSANHSASSSSTTSTDSSISSGSANHSDTENPKTGGDTIVVVAIVCVVLLAGVAVAVLFIKKNKKRNK